MKAIFIAIAAFTAAPAIAGTPLWQNVEEDMTVDQVRALYSAAVQHRTVSTFAIIVRSPPARAQCA